jgi:hypothetical protein
MSQGTQALVYAMLVEGHYSGQSAKTHRSSRSAPRTPILRRFID